MADNAFGRVGGGVGYGYGLGAWVGHKGDPANDRANRGEAFLKRVVYACHVTLRIQLYKHQGLSTLGELWASGGVVNNNPG